MPEHPKRSEPQRLPSLPGGTRRAASALALALLIGGVGLLRAYDFLWFFARLFSGRLTIKQMRERGWWW